MRICEIRLNLAIKKYDVNADRCSSHFDCYTFIIRRCFIVFDFGSLNAQFLNLSRLFKVYLPFFITTINRDTEYK